MKVNQLKGSYEATATIEGTYTLEQRAEIIERVTAQIEAQGGRAYVEGDILKIEGSGQYLRLPVLAAVRRGKITFTGGRYVFEWQDEKGGWQTSGGEKPKLVDMWANGFSVDMHGGGRIVYELRHKCD